MTAGLSEWLGAPVWLSPQLATLPGQDGMGPRWRGAVPCAVWDGRAETSEGASSSCPSASCREDPALLCAHRPGALVSPCPSEGTLLPQQRRGPHPTAAPQKCARCRMVMQVSGPASARVGLRTLGSSEPGGSMPHSSWSLLGMLSELKATWALPQALGLAGWRKESRAERGPRDRGGVSL